MLPNHLVHFLLWEETWRNCSLQKYFIKPCLSFPPLLHHNPPVHTQTRFSLSSDRGAGPSAGEGGEQPPSQRAGNHCAILGNAVCPLCFGSHPQLGLRRREIKSMGMPVKHEAVPPTSVETAGHGLCGSLGRGSLLFRRRSPRGWLPEAVPAVLWSREETGQKRVDVEQLSSPSSGPFLVYRLRD